MSMFKETHLEKISLLSDGTTIDAALNFVKSKQEQQLQQQKEQDNNDSAATVVTADNNTQTVF